MAAQVANKLHFLWMITLSALLAAFCVKAAPVAASTPSPEPVRFSLAEVDPWAGVNDNGEPYGLLVKLVEELAERTGIPMDYHVRPHSRAALELREGTVDFAPTFRAPHLEEIGEPVAPLVEVRRLVIGLADRAPIESLDELAGATVGYLSGTWYGKTFESHEGLNRMPVKNFSHGLSLLKRERLQAVVATDIAVSSRHSNGDADLRVLMELEEGVGMIYQSHRSQRDDAARAIQDAMDSMARDGFLEELFSDRFELSRDGVSR